MLTVLGGLAEFERDLIRARTSEGRERAKARGVKMGRKPKLTPHQQREAIRRRDSGDETVRDIAAASMSTTRRFRGWRHERTLAEASAVSCPVGRGETSLGCGRLSAVRYV